MYLPGLTPSHLSWWHILWTIWQRSGVDNFPKIVSKINLQPMPHFTHSTAYEMQERFPGAVLSRCIFTSPWLPNLENGLRTRRDHASRQQAAALLDSDLHDEHSRTERDCTRGTGLCLLAKRATTVMELQLCGNVSYSCTWKYQLQQTSSLHGMLSICYAVYSRG